MHAYCQMWLSLGVCPGARRGILQLPGVEEDVGMIGIHWRGQFIEMVPWNGEVQASPLSKQLLCHANYHPAIVQSARPMQDRL